MCTSMRLFTGLSIEGAALEKLVHALHELRRTADLKWSPPENLHITTKFIGQWPADKLPELQQTLAAVEPRGPVEITLSRFGFYPNPHRPQVFFAGVQGGPELADLARRIDEALSAIGCEREQRPWSPHVTLARIRKENIRALREHIAHMVSMNKFDFGSFEAVEFHLYSSETSSGGSVYSKLSSYPLVRAA